MPYTNINAIHKHTVCISW